MAPPEKPPSCLKWSSPSRARNVSLDNADSLVDSEATAGWRKAMSRCLRPAQSKAPSVARICDAPPTDETLVRSFQGCLASLCLSTGSDSAKKPRLLHTDPIPGHLAGLVSLLLPNSTLSNQSLFGKCYKGTIIYLAGAQTHRGWHPDAHLVLCTVSEGMLAQPGQPSTGCVAA